MTFRGSLRMLCTRRIATTTSRSSRASYIACGNINYLGHSTNPNAFRSNARFLSQQADNSDTPLDSVDFFAMLQLTSGRRYQLDMDQLKSNYRRLMAEHHPDKLKHNATADATEFDASQITHAYQILKEPHTRATHLLELLGRSINPDNSNNNNNSPAPSTLVGPAFLLHIMELREEIDGLIEDLQRAKSISTTSTSTAMKSLQNLMEETKEQIQTITKDLDQAFEGDDLDRAMELSAQLQYWKRIQDTIQEHLEE